MKAFNKFFPFLLIAGILTNANGLLNEIIEPDGALYATIAKHIALTGDWLNLIGDGHDWLDKPHFPFWVAAASFKLFGINDFAYKLPGFLFWLGGIWYTYVLTKKLYNSYTAKIAIVLYVFALHGILGIFDVRAEPYLTTLSIGAIYYFYKANQTSGWKYIFLTALLAAMAIMTKGIFVLVTIGAGFIFYWASVKQWKQLLNYRWWLMLLLIILFITPELYSLYLQFDLHPEKVVFGQTNVSGLKFFIWDSQFGRFFNTGPITGKGDKTFFLHTTLWAFLPWSILLYIAVFRLFKNPKKNASGPRWIVYGSAAITFLMFSFSAFQLPHYIIILFPHFAIISADYLANLQAKTTISRLAILQNVLLIVAGIAVSVLSYYSGFGNPAIVSIISAAVIILTLFFFRNRGTDTIIFSGAAFSIVLFMFLHNFFYPQLLHYQSGMLAGKWLRNNQPEIKTALYKYPSYTYEFYAPGFVETIETSLELDHFLEQNKEIAIYTSTGEMNELVSKGYKCRFIKSFPHYHVSRLTKSFLDRSTRVTALRHLALVVVEKKVE
jgi:4-amino-4-deoxy-L-arabinose transferase-like glycosyltransferase